MTQLSDRKPPGGTAGFSGDTLTLGTEGVAADWKVGKDGVTKRYAVSRNSVYYEIIDPSVDYGQIKWCPGGGGAASSRIGIWPTSDDLGAGLIYWNTDMPANGMQWDAPQAGAGFGRGWGCFNGTKWTDVMWFANPSSGQPTLNILTHSGTLKVFGGPGQAGQATFGAATAGALWDATAQAMVQKCYDLNRAIGFGS